MLVRLTVPALAAVALLATPVRAQTTPMPPSDGVLRVCADPDNLPLSNDKGEGIENKIAEIIGRAWNQKVEYAWWPVRRGFFTRGLNGGVCDVAITAPVGLDVAAVTKPFFRTAYVIVTRVDRSLDIKTLDDPRLKTLKIGVNLLNSDAENTPPAMALSRHGVVGNLVGFTTFFSEGGDRPEDIINAVVDGKVDVAIVWGPLAGYWAKQAKVPLTLTMLTEDPGSGIPFAYSLGMATRRRAVGLRDSLQTVLETRRGEIDEVLKSFAVPLLPLPPDSAKQVGSSR